ncbi:MAG: ABC transporter substrate-binding protein, partial [Dechloromonas sp.]|nr:ABC transporter substrate-binding protein [Dechloromonas sp.]
MNALSALRHGLLMLALLLGCAGTQAAEPLRLALSQTPLSLPFYVAKQQGFFSAEGLHIQIEEVIGGHRSMQRLLAGEADLTT